VPAFYQILKGGGLASGGLNFDAKVRRQSIDPQDLLIGHIGGLDVCAQALEAAARLIEDGAYDRFLVERYAGWDSAAAKAMLGGQASLDDIAGRAARERIDPKPKSGRQEFLENLLNRFV
jgi:xylose isomerase